jgi:hypothetical protein
LYGRQCLACGPAPNYPSKRALLVFRPTVLSIPLLYREDVFLLRAMEQPTYSSVNELPAALRPKQAPEQGRTCVNDSDRSIS